MQNGNVDEYLVKEQNADRIRLVNPFRTISRLRALPGPNAIPRSAISRQASSTSTVKILSMEISKGYVALSV